MGEQTDLGSSVCERHDTSRCGVDGMGEAETIWSFESVVESVRDTPTQLQMLRLIVSHGNVRSAGRGTDRRRKRNRRQRKTGTQRIRDESEESKG